MRNSRLWLVATVVCVVAVVGAGASPSPEKVLADFKVFRETYPAAIGAGDLETFASIWDVDGIRMPPNAAEIQGRAAIKAAMEKAFSMFTFEMVTVPDEFIMAGDYIIVRGHYTMTQRPKAGGDPIRSDGKNLTVWKKQDGGRWTLYRDCYNSNVP